jgi:DNA repair protein RecO (recombination protein O)
MTTKHELQLAYVLHSRAYRETSLLVEMLSQEHGKIALVARGAKRGKSKSSAILQPFAPLHVSWYGNGELVTLTQIEPAGIGHGLYGRRAICGLYVNELLIKLLHKWDPCLQLFIDYQNVLNNLADANESEQISLRKFEKQLLKSIGYGLQLTKEVESGELVQADEYYIFDPVVGPKKINVGAGHRAGPIGNINAVKGASLLALESEQFESAEILADIKYLMRLVFAHHMGKRRIVTRELL